MLSATGSTGRTVGLSFLAMGLLLPAIVFEEGVLRFREELEGIFELNYLIILFEFQNKNIASTFENLNVLHFRKWNKKVRLNISTI